MPKITKGGVSDATTAPGYIAPPGLVPQEAQAAGVPDAGALDEDISPDNTSVSTPEPDEKPEPKKAAPAKKTTAAKR